eukprot:7350155-Pyramimonas_sp.AAC.1
MDARPHTGGGFKATGFGFKATGVDSRLQGMDARPHTGGGFKATGGGFNSSGGGFGLRAGLLSMANAGPNTNSS